MSISRDIAAVLVAYSLGCVMGGYYIVRLRTGLDLRQQGSGNVGARNAGRVLGPTGFALTFLIDAGKGMAAVWVARHLGAGPVGLVCVLLAVAAGHLWPAQLGFHGGKGIATAFGALLVYDWRIVGLWAGLFLVARMGLRNSTLCCLAGMALTPVAMGLCGFAGIEVLGMALLSALILLAHWRNIQEEIAGMSARR